MNINTSCFLHILKNIGYGIRESADLEWVEDIPVLRSVFQFIHTNFTILSKDELQTLKSAPGHLLNLSSEQLDQLIMQLEETFIDAEAELNNVNSADSVIKGANPYIQEIVAEIPTTTSIQELPDLSVEVERLQVKVKENRNFIMNIGDPIHAQIASLQQLFASGNREHGENVQLLETYTQREGQFLQLLNNVVKEVDTTIESIMIKIQNYTKECSMAITYHQESLASVLYQRLNHLLCSSRLHKLITTIPLFEAGKYLPQFPVTLQEFLVVHKEYEQLRNACSNLASNIICCPEALLQRLAVETLVQRCYDYHNKTLETLFEVISDTLHRERKGLEYANRSHQFITMALNAVGEFSTFLCHVQKEYISPTVTVLGILQKTKDDMVFSPAASLGYQSVISAITGSPIHGAAQLADALLLASKPIIHENDNDATADLTEALNLQGRSVDFITDGNVKDAQSTLFLNLRRAISEVQKLLGRASHILKFNSSKSAVNSSQS